MFLFEATERDTGDDDLITGDTPECAAQLPMEDKKEALMRSLLREQVFLGMVASRIPLKAQVQEDIDDIMKAGVRFVFFSPRNMRRSKSLAEKMGIETDWNCAISLRAQDVDTTPDWMAKARLPHGVDAIRRHIAEVDNVPLLVSLYTDATPGPTREMFQIFQSNFETVLCLGSSHCTSYAELFDVADISISIQSVEEFFCPRGTFTTELSVADLEFNDALIGLSCDITLPSNTHRRRGHSLRATLDLVQEGRRLLLNICQLMAFSISVTSTLVLFMICSQILPIRVPPTFHSTNVFWIQILMTMFVSLPMLAFGADPNTLTQPSCKNNADEIDHTSARRCVFFVAARTIPTVLFCTVVALWAFGAYLLQEESIENLPCTIDNKIDWWDLFWCDDIESGRYQTSVKNAHVASEALTTFAVIWALTWQSAGYAYRTASIFSMSPLSNSVWVIGAFFTLLFQALHTTIRIRLFTKKTISWVPWKLWLLIFTWPAISLAIGERVKAEDARKHNLHLNFLRLDFSTRLGMYSPR